MDQSFVTRSMSRLVKSQLRGVLAKAFPKIPENHLEVQLNSINNSIDFEYQTPTIVKLFNMLKKQNVFEGVENVKAAAQAVAAAHDPTTDNIIKAITTTDQGFLNIALNDSLIEQEINTILKKGIRFPDSEKKTIVVDFSSPNIAKEMHVGHLRSTIIGESLCRILEFQGHKVARINHVGDWGTQFGMLIQYMQIKYPNYKTEKPILSELEELYREAKKKFDEDPDFKKDSQQKVVQLQSLDPECVDVWKMICQLSRDEFNKIYKRLGITLIEMGESFYNPQLRNIIQECEEKGIVKEDKGAKCIFIPGNQIPLMIQKSDGGFNYDTTDMATAKYRIQEMKGDRLIYITDLGQFPHFKLIFEASKMMGWHVPPKTSMEHMGFGLVLGPDGKKFKTRSGETVKLNSLLEEAKKRALDQIKKRAEDQSEGKEFSTGTSLQPEEFEDAAEKMGMAAVKYFDLKQNRTGDYAFQYEKMLDPKGNTAVYLMYSYVRMCSVLRKAQVENMQTFTQVNEYKINHPYERYLAASLIKFVDVLQSVSDQLAINWLCDFIYDICTKVSESYSKFRILNDEHTVPRVLLCEAVRQVLSQAFYLVGIDPVEKL